MAVCIDKTVDGFLYVTETKLETCTTYVLQAADEYNLSHVTVSPSDIGLVFTWSFGAVVVIGYLGGYVIGIAKKLIRLV
ncbi:hypothetical protein [Vibrio lentus]|uniref:hypothetical protein n=1 Tax=Vibrio lentus TaxID=136468 RepID=UPI000C8173BC|nr:hypothetical protein [Vibrio lentus]PMM24926.1 hypothetical protein BCT58_11705 [Vibrio lentus]